MSRIFSKKIDLSSEEIMEPYDDYDFDLNGDESLLLEGHYRKKRMDSEKIFKYLYIIIFILAVFYTFL